MSDPMPTARQRWLPWHRRVGVFASAFVLLIASTGIVLNHTDDFRLDERYVQSPWLLSWYGIDPVATEQVYQQGSLWVSRHGDTLFANGEALAHCEELRSVQVHERDVLALCTDKGWLLSPKGELLEPWPSSQPLPTLTPDRHRRAVAELPPEWRHRIETQGHAAPHSIHWERVLLDLHSGRLFGAAGIWVFDVAALLFIFLALSGVWVWAGKRKANREVL